MQNHDTVLNSYVETLVATVTAQGVETGTLLAVVPLEQQHLARSGGRLSMDIMTLLWQRAVELTHDPYLGLHVGQHLQLGAFNILSSLILNCNTVKEAIEYALQFQSLISEGGSLSLEREEECFSIVYTPTQRKIAMTHFQVEGVICGLVKFSRSFLPQSVTPFRIEFTHSTDIDIRPYETFFNCAVHFNAPQNRLLFSADILNHKIPHADPELFQYQLALAERKLAAINGHKGQANSVRKAIDNEVDWLTLSPEKIAAKLNLSLRQMQRLLHGENKSYQDILNAARKEKAAHLLKDTTLETQRIAEQLGYNNLSSFHRAFKRWYSATPAEYRLRNA